MKVLTINDIDAGDDCDRPYKNGAVKSVTSDGTLDRKQIKIRQKEV